MAKDPDRPNAPKGRDPAKHSKKDPARPTRAKASRPDAAPLDSALADLLNPAIGRGRAGVGSQTGIEPHGSHSDTSPRRGEVGRESDSEGGRERGVDPIGSSPSPDDAPRRHPLPDGEWGNERTGLQPPPDNSLDRRADFANAHRARASVARGFGEAPQQGYVGKSPTPVPPGELDPDLAKALGIDEEESGTTETRRRHHARYGRGA